MDKKTNKEEKPTEDTPLADALKKVNLNECPDPAAANSGGDPPQPPSGSDRINIQLRIPDRQMAKEIMDKTIEVLQQSASETTDPEEREQALQCIQLIRRDNAHLTSLGKPGL